MSKLMHVTAACLYAAVAAASLMGLAAASSNAEERQSGGCKTAVCFVALF